VLLLNNGTTLDGIVLLYQLTIERVKQLLSDAGYKYKVTGFEIKNAKYY
jgi:hypothetical protein